MADEFTNMNDPDDEWDDLDDLDDDGDPEPISDWLRQLIEDSDEIDDECKECMLTHPERWAQTTVILEEEFDCGDCKKAATVPWIYHLK